MEASIAAARPRRRRWLWVLLGGVMVLAVAVIVWLVFGPSQPLNQAEQALVGAWTLPMGPNPPPPNAVQQIFWLRADRSLLVGHRPVGTFEVNFTSKGAWRLDGEHLVLHAQGLESPGQSLARAFGHGPKQPRMDDRFRILGQDGDVLRVEGAGDSVATFLRLPE